MSILFLVFLALFGLAIGSFINVLTLRYNPERHLLSRENYAGRSHCRNCGKTLSWYELLPLISFVIQRGKCRSCGSALTWQYPLVELICGVIFVAVPLFIQNNFFEIVPMFGWVYFSVVCAIWIIAMLALIMVFVIDLRHYIIPNGLNFFIFILGVLWVIIGWRMNLFDSVMGGSFMKEFAPLFFSFSNPIYNHLFGMVIVILLFFLITLFSGGRAMGMGDVKLVAGLGLLFGWPDIILVMMLSFVVGAIISIILMAVRRKHMRDKIPFGPFIVVASFITFFFGSGLLSVYFGIIGL